MLYVKNCKQRLNGHKKQKQRRSSNRSSAGEATQRRAHNEIENKKEQQKNVKWQRENTTRNTLQQLATRHVDALAYQLKKSLTEKKLIDLYYNIE